PPASCDYYTKAAPSVSRMYRNNVKGCCVISGKFHLLGIWTANDTDSPGVALATDTEVDSQYARICGPGDNGCYIPAVLDWFKKNGLVLGGKTYKTDWW